MDKPLRVAAVLQQTVTPRPGQMLPADIGITTACAACGREQNLFEAKIGIEFEGDTIYRCVSCGELLVVVTRGSLENRWAGRGAILHGTRILHKSDLFVRVTGAKVGKGLHVPGYPDAFDRRDD